jgi:hypothetical protein
LCLLLRACGDLGEAIRGQGDAIQAIKVGKPWNVGLGCHLQLQDRLRLDAAGKTRSCQVGACLKLTGTQLENPLPVYYSSYWRQTKSYLQHSYDIHRARESPLTEIARVAFMFSEALAKPHVEGAMQRGLKLREETDKTSRELKGNSEKQPASEAVFDMLVDGQLHWIFVRRDWDARNNVLSRNPLPGIASLKVMDP